MSESGLIRVRSVMPVTRRGFNAGLLAAAGAAATLGLGSRRAFASDVVFLGWQGYDEALYVDDFMDREGIQLATTYIGNNDEIVTKLRAGGVGTVDIVTPYMGYVPLLAQTNLIAPIDEALVPNLEDVMPLFKNDSNINVGGKLYGVPFTWGAFPMMYNPAVIPEAPESWDDLFKAEYEGKVGLMDDALGNIMLAARIVTDAESATFLTHAQLKEAVDYVIRLKEKHIRMVAVSWGELSDALSRGDVTITFGGWEAIKKFAADAGAVIEYTYPKEGTFAWLDNYCIAKDAPNWEIDHALANQIIGVPAQVKIGTEFVQGIVNTKAVEALDDATRALYPYDDPTGMAETMTFYTFPPLEADGVHATFEEWIKEWERFKAA